MTDTIEPPPEIMDCARRLIEWARERGLQNWSVLGIGPKFIGEHYLPPDQAGVDGEVCIRNGRIWVWKVGRWQYVAP